MLNHYCPGSFTLRNNITLDIKSCPQCSADVELFSIDKKAACDQCGFIVYNNLQACIDWCRYAEQCFGTEQYNMLKQRA